VDLSIITVCNERFYSILSRYRGHGDLTVVVAVVTVAVVVIVVAVADAAVAVAATAVLNVINAMLCSMRC
jgi:hypothetical protein